MENLALTPTWTTCVRFRYGQKLVSPLHTLRLSVSATGKFNGLSSGGGGHDTVCSQLPRDKTVKSTQSSRAQRLRRDDATQLS